MNAMNELMRRGASAALGAVYQLSDAGHTVHCIVIRGGVPVLLIDAPDTPIDGAQQSTRIDGGVRRSVYSATVANCRVEWESRAPARRAFGAAR